MKIIQLQDKLNREIIEMTNLKEAICWFNFTATNCWPTSSFIKVAGILTMAEVTLNDQTSNSLTSWEQKDVKEWFIQWITSRQVMKIKKIINFVILYVSVNSYN